MICCNVCILTKLPEIDIYIVAKLCLLRTSHDALTFSLLLPKVAPLVSVFTHYFRPLLSNVVHSFKTVVR